MDAGIFSFRSAPTPTGGSGGTRSETGSSPPPILLYDGSCGACTRSIRFLLRRDKRRQSLQFAPLQGRVAAAILKCHPESWRMDSLVWCEQIDGSMELWFRSEAVLAAGRYLGGVWAFLAGIARIVPRRLRDKAYNAFARNRRRIPGVREVCRLPTPEESVRFLLD